MSTTIYQTAQIYIYINLCSPTLKSYVGFTTDFERRKKEHLYYATHEASGYFYNAIRKYGWKNFIPFVLEETNDIEFARDELEPRYIKLCKSFSKENGYNMTLGGEGCMGYVCSEETKRKIGNASRGKQLSEETKRKMSQAHLGKLRSQETKQKISNTLQGKCRGAMSDITKAKIAKAHKGKHHSQESKLKMSKAKKGKPISESHKANISRAKRNII
jgi:group I intron endonuclease